MFWANIFICGMIAWSLGRDMGAFIYYDKMKSGIENTIVNSLYDFELGSILRLRGVDIDVVPEEVDLKKLVLKADEENKDITQALQEYFAKQGDTVDTKIIRDSINTAISGSLLKGIRVPFVSSSGFTSVLENNDDLSDRLVVLVYGNELHSAAELFTDTYIKEPLSDVLKFICMFGIFILFVFVHYEIKRK
jgi:hypothetical protein